MSIQVYSSPVAAELPFVPLESGMPIWQEKKGGHGGGGGGKGGGGHSSGSGRSGGNGNSGSNNYGGRTPGNYYYNGRNYQYGHPVQYLGNRYYPGGMILPVAFGAGAGYLMAGHIYHTYTSSDTLIYSEVPTMCGHSTSSTDTTESYATCITTPLSFTDGGGLVTIQENQLESASYSTLSDDTTTLVTSTTSDGTTESSATETSVSTPHTSVSSISSQTANNASPCHISWYALFVAALALSI